MTTPNTIKLDKRFFMGGHAIFTVDNGQGTRYTFRIGQPKEQRPGYTGPAPHFISLLTGPDNASFHCYTYMGMVEEAPIKEKTIVEGQEIWTDTGKRTLLVKLTKKSKYTDDTQPVKVARWVLHMMMIDKALPEGYKVYHEGKCGCCGRRLTVPESIERGIGPECWKRMN